MVSRALRLRHLNRAKDEFLNLSKKSFRKAKVYKFTDIFIKAVLSISGGLITYFADPNNMEEYKNIIRIFGIIIASFTALTSIFMFEKRSLSNIQIYNKCQVVIPEIEDKIDAVKSGENINENIQDYIHRIFKDLSDMNLATFTDTTLERINSKISI
jgi:hypothetical protein